MNGVRRLRWRGPPLALQIMALLVGGLVVAQLATLLLTLLLPPAPAPQYGLDDIAATLLDDPAGQASRNGLQRVVQAGPPDVSGSGWLVSERSRGELAKLIGVEPGRVTLAFYTPLPFAGTAAARSLAMANDGYLPPFKAAAYARPASFVASGQPHLILAQFAAVQGIPPMPRGNRLDGANPGRDTLPPGMIGRAGPGAMPGMAAGALGQARGAMLQHQDHNRPLVSIDPRYAGAGLFIPGDGGAAVPALLSGAGAVAEQVQGAMRAGSQAMQAAQAAQAAQSTQVAQAAGAIPAITNGEIAAARPEFSPALRANGMLGGRPVGDIFARALPTREAMGPMIVAPAPAGRVAPPLIVQPFAPPQAAIAPPQSRAAEPPAVASTPAPEVNAQPRLLPAPTPPHFLSTPEAVPYEEPDGPPIMITPTRRSLFGLAQAPFVEGDFVASLKLANGKWVVVQPAAEPFPNSWQRRVLLWFVLAAAVVIPLGWLFARRLVNPLHRFAAAAEQLGREPSAAIVPLDGPAEIGRAAHAFNLMQGRLRAFVGDRTAMVGAISHDLRTPLTRMRFRIEDVAEDDVRDGLLEEVEEMEAMITQVIEFIRDASTPGARERLDLRTLVDDVIEDARLVGGDVTVEQADRAPVEVDVLGMRRLLDNLLENAVKYGARARIRLRAEAEDVVAEIIDDGPGLPDEELERVFEPFYRSDEAIASDKKGSGLGLAVCRSIARAHGGDVRLVRQPDGFRAEVRLPMAFGDKSIPAL